ncbi:MAG: redoxin domain-containing protein [Bacteroidaceae bacterium]|nr:redoxin domain-containing protein [Bacteroidaceae bacterium]
MKKTLIIALLAISFSLTTSATDWSNLIGKELVLHQWGNVRDGWFSDYHPMNTMGADPIERIILKDATHAIWKYTQQGDFERECSIQGPVLTFNEPIFGNKDLRILKADGEVILTLGGDSLTRAFYILNPKPDTEQLPVSINSKKGFCNGKLNGLLTHFTDLTYSSRTPMGRHFQLCKQAKPDEKLWLESKKEAFDDDKEQTEAYNVNLFPNGKPLLADIQQEGIILSNALGVLKDMASMYPDFIKSIIRQEAPDSFCVDMFAPEGKPIQVCVSNRFPQSDKEFFSMGENGTYIWLSILEKAVMKWLNVYNNQMPIAFYSAEWITPMLTGDGRSFCIQPGRMASKDLAKVVNTCRQNGMMVNGVADSRFTSLLGTPTVTNPDMAFRIISPGAAANYFDRNAIQEKIKVLANKETEKPVKIKLKKGKTPQLLNYPCADMNQLPLHGGEVVIKGRIIPGGPQIAKQFEGRISALMRNYIAGTEKTTLFEIKEDGTFSLNLQVPYPMYLFVYPIAEVYACPGDTVDITIDITKPTKKEGVTLDGTGLSGEVSKLTKKIRSTYCDFSADYNPSAEKNNLTPDSLLKRKDELVARLDEMVCRINAGLPELDGCSPMASDIIRTYIVAAYTEHICDYYMRHERDGFDTGEIWPKFFSFAAPRERYMLDNPLLMISGDFSFFNRIQFVLLSPIIYAHNGNLIFGADEKEAMNELQDKLKLSPTDFCAQVSMLHKLVGYTFKYRDVLVSQMKEKANDFIADEVAKIFSVISHPEIMRQAVIAYNEHIKEYEMKVVEDKPMTKADSIFQRIIEPYKGNVLYVDFWEMSCGPCRGLMLNMRDEVDANKDKPVKYLYITDDTEEQCRPFLEPNNIKGEHIHITRSEWGYLQEKFQFSGIPYHFILDKNGKRREGVTIEELLKE